MSSEQPESSYGKAILNAALANHLRKKPIGWGRRSRSPYFTNKNALWIKKLIDAQIDSRQEIHIPYIQEGLDLSPNTWYLKVNQGINYILEHYDDDLRYKHWHEETELKRNNSSYIVIRYFEGGCSPDGALVSMDSKEKIWLRDLEEWLESDSIEPYIREGLKMTPEQADIVLRDLQQLIGIEFSVGPTFIKAIKL